jgi:hypothetical protein
MKDWSQYDNKTAVAFSWGVPKKKIPLLPSVCPGVITVVLFIVIASSLGCAAMRIKPWSQRDYQEKAQTMMAAYNRQFNETMEMASYGNLSDKQKDVVRLRISLLEKAWPLIRGYDELIVRGEKPSAELEQEILNILTKLIDAGG